MGDWPGDEKTGSRLKSVFPVRLSCKPEFNSDRFFPLIV